MSRTLITGQSVAALQGPVKILQYTRTRRFSPAEELERHSLYLVIQNKIHIHNYLPKIRKNVMQNIMSTQLDTYFTDLDVNSSTENRDLTEG